MTGVDDESTELLVALADEVVVVEYGRIEISELGKIGIGAEFSRLARLRELDEDEDEDDNVVSGTVDEIVALELEDELNIVDVELLELELDAEDDETMLESEESALTLALLGLKVDVVVISGTIEGKTSRSVRLEAVEVGSGTIEGKTSRSVTLDADVVESGTIEGKTSRLVMLDMNVLVVERDETDVVSVTDDEVLEVLDCSASELGDGLLGTTGDAVEK